MTRLSCPGTSIGISGGSGVRLRRDHVRFRIEMRTFPRTTE
jgi:hypothetical protein